MCNVLNELSFNIKFSKEFWKYEGIGYRNSLVNAGIIVQTIYLVAETMTWIWMFGFVF